MKGPQLWIVYARVSTREQGKSGLGLEAQRQACEEHIAEEGGEIIASYSEVGSGGNDDRPEFVKAIKLARRTGATLVVSKLDRISRAVALIANMLAEGIPLRIVEIPNASTLEIHLRAVIAQEERDAASKRTREALAIAKQRGVKLGSSRPGHWSGRTESGELRTDRRLDGQRNGAAAWSAKRKARNADMLDEVADLIRETAELSLRAVAVELEERGIRTALGKRSWAPAQVARLRAAILEPAT